GLRVRRRLGGIVRGDRGDGERQTSNAEGQRETGSLHGVVPESAGRFIRPRSGRLNQLNRRAGWTAMRTGVIFLRTFARVSPKHIMQICVAVENLGRTRGVDAGAPTTARRLDG